MKEAKIALENLRKSQGWRAGLVSSLQYGPLASSPLFKDRIQSLLGYEGQKIFNPNLKTENPIWQIAKYRFLP